MKSAKPFIIFCLLLSCSNNGTDTQNDPTTKEDVSIAPISDAGVKDASTEDSESDESSIKDSQIETASPDSNKPSIIAGDWFPCLDDACTELHHIGERYQVSPHSPNAGLLVYLYAHKKPHDGSSYCHLTRRVLLGEYILNGKTLIKTLDNVYKHFEGKPYAIEIHEDIMVRTEEGQTTSQRLKRISGQSNPCSEISDYTICPRYPIKTDTDEYCFATYSCTKMTLNLECSMKRDSSTVYECTCEDFLTGKKTTFDTEEFCKSGMADVEATRFANKKCGWDIWIPEMLD